MQTMKKMHQYKFVLTNGDERVESPAGSFDKIMKLVQLTFPSILSFQNLHDLKTNRVLKLKDGSIMIVEVKDEEIRDGK